MGTSASQSIRAVRLASRTLAVLAATWTAALVIIITADYTMRNLTGNAIPGVVEYSEILLVSLVYLGIAYTQQQNKHVNLKFFTRLVPARLGYVGTAIGFILTALLLAWITYATTIAAVESVRTGEFRYGLLRVPTWPARLSVAVGFLLLTAENLIDLAAMLRQDSATWRSGRLSDVPSSEGPV